MKKIMIIIIYCVIFTGVVANTECYFDISGKIYNKNNEPIHIFLVDEETSKIPLSGIQTLIITPDDIDLSRGYILFRFNKIKSGVYGIRCFQDMNANNKLDKGLFGPIEPWGFSWNEKKNLKWPKFKSYCFWLDKKIDKIDIFFEETREIK